MFLIFFMLFLIGIIALGTLVIRAGLKTGLAANRAIHVADPKSSKR